MRRRRRGSDDTLPSAVSARRSRHDAWIDSAPAAAGHPPRDDGHAPGDADLIRAAPHLGGVHRLEQVVHQPAHGVSTAATGRSAAAARASRAGELADGHCGLAASTER